MDDASEKDPLLSGKEDNDKKQQQEEDAKEACFAKANCWSQLVFGWFTPMLALGHSKSQLEPTDLHLLPLAPKDTTDHVMQEFDQAWDKELKRNPSNPSVTLALFRAFGKEFCMAGILKVGNDVLQFVGPQVLNGIIQFLRDPEAPLWHGLAYTGIVTCAQLGMSLCLRHYFFILFRVGLRVRTAIVMAVYRKSLTAKSFRQEQSTGQITNLMSVDATRLQGLTTFLHALWYSFLQIALAIYFLWQQLGPSCLAGVAVIILSIPVTTALAKLMGKLQKGLMKARDERIEINNEVLGNMKIIKLQAWEEPFLEKIEALRKKELHQLFLYLLGRACTFLTFSAVPLLVALATFAGYTLSGHPLDVASALTALALFEILRFPLFMFPNVINSIVEGGVSLDRIQKFLISPDHQPVTPGALSGVGANMVDATFVYDSKRYSQTNDENKEGDNAAENKEAAPATDKQAAKMAKMKQETSDVKWELQLIKAQLASAEQELAEKEGRTDYGTMDTTSEIMTAGDLTLLALRRMNFAVNNDGGFIAVVGGVGSGKSSFLKAFLGEVTRISGSCHIQGKIAYFGQNPFIMNDTVKGNILFGTGATLPNEALYQTTLEACSLQHDLQLLPKGDQCEIGEKGITLSGGQKARVAMARAMYHNADIFLLDDPLAAVDAHVGRHLFEKCICEKLLHDASGKKRIVILVTNALQYLSHALVDQIVVLKDGRIVEQGTYQELLNKGQQFQSFLDSFHETMAADDSKTDIADKDKDILTDSDDFFTKPPAPGTNTRVQSEPVSVLKTTPLPQKRPSRSQSMATTPRRRSSRRISLVDVRNSRESVEELELQDVIAALDLDDEDTDDNETTKTDEETQDDDEDGSPNKKNKREAGTLMTDEYVERQQGEVNMSVYLSWFRASGGIIVGFVILFLYIIGAATTILSKWWLTVWSEDGGAGGSVSQYKFLAIYGVINIAAIFAQFLKMFVVLLFALTASRRLFTKVLNRTLRAPMSFFDTTPLGRIINRFSQDVNSLDEELPGTFQSFLSTSFNVISTIVVISFVTPIFILVLVPILILYRKEQVYFTGTYRELKRLDSVSKSPIYALFGETLDGVGTIRAFSAEVPLERRMVSMVDKQQHAYFLTSTAQCWLGLRLEVIGTVIIFVACLAAVLEHGTAASNETFAGLAGLSISYALSVTQSLNWTVRMASDFEANMVAIERLEQYSQMETEAPRKTKPDESLDPNWPSKGVIEFKDAKLRYRPELPLVLKGLNIVVPSYSKVGIVGRTGAGKSTLMTALLRLVELDQGQLLIDGVDTRTLGLARLRSKIAVIPQDPVLFTGTIKHNLDPFDTYSDDHISQILARVGLMAPAVAAAPSTSGSSSSLDKLAQMACIKSLSDKVLDAGSNFSVGEKQLLVIARALLCGAGVVICDEATAAVDAETDARIQKILREDFTKATVLTVAHRLNTIMDSDYILTMDDGKAAEFGKPSELLAKKDGVFKQLVDTWEEEHGKK